MTFDLKSLEEFLVAKKITISPEYLAPAIWDTTSKNSNTSSSEFKKKNVLQGLKMKYLISLFRKSIQDKEDSDNNSVPGSEASSKALNSYNNISGHDSKDYPPRLAND